MLVQSPVISSALRAALALEGGGAFPMEADGTIVPVAIVADISRELTTERIPCWQGSYSAAGGAGQYSWCQLRWPAGSAGVITHIEVSRVTVRSPSSLPVYIGLQGDQGGTPGFQLPRRKDSSLQQSALVGAAAYGFTASVPSTFLPNVGRIVGAVAGIDSVIEFPEPLVLARDGDALTVIAATSNADLYANFDWIEVRK